MRAKLIYLSIIILGLIVSFGLARTLYSYYQNSKLLSSSQEKLQQLQKENDQLKSQTQEASAPDYIARQAREKLGLVKAGEVVVIIPPQVEATSSSRSKINSDKPIWKQWWSLFFGG